MKQFWSWLGNVLAGEALVQFVATVPSAYLIGKAHEWASWGWGVVMIDVLPPLFWPIISVLFLLVAIPHAFVKPALRSLRKWKAAKYERSDAARFQRMVGTLKHELHETIADICVRDGVESSRGMRFAPRLRGDRGTLGQTLLNLGIEPPNPHEHELWLNMLPILVSLAEEGDLEKARRFSLRAKEDRDEG